MLFNPGLMEQPPFLPLPPGLSGALYTLVYLEPPNTPMSTWSPHYPMVYLEPHYSLVNLEPLYPLIYMRAPRLPPDLPGYLKKRLNRTSSPLESVPSYVNILYKNQ